MDKKKGEGRGEKRKGYRRGSKTKKKSKPKGLRQTPKENKRDSTFTI